MSNRTLCPVCGLGVPIDEDGCCAQCGATATGKGADEVLASLAAERQRAEAATGLLRDLRNQTYGALWMEQAEIEQVVGVTNFRAIELGIAEADAFLSASPPAAPPEAPDPYAGLGTTFPGALRRAIALAGAAPPEVSDQEEPNEWSRCDHCAADLYGEDAPIAPVDPLVQAVLDAAEEWEEANNEYGTGLETAANSPPVQEYERLRAAEDDLAEAVAALRARKEAGDG